MEIRKSEVSPPEFKSLPVVEKKTEKTAKPEIQDQVELKKSPLKKAKAWANRHLKGSGSEKSDRDFSPMMLEELSTLTGATVGGAVGTFAGLIAGSKEHEKDRVSLEWKSRNIEDPKLRGYHHNIQEQGHWEEEVVGVKPGYWEKVVTGHDKEGNPISEKVYHEPEAITRDRYEVDGYWHRFSPDIEQKTVETFKRPEYRHSGLDPLTGGALGLLIGAGSGALLGLLVGAISRAVQQRGGER